MNSNIIFRFPLNMKATGYNTKKTLIFSIYENCTFKPINNNLIQTCLFSCLLIVVENSDIANLM